MKTSRLLPTRIYGVVNIEWVGVVNIEWVVLKNPDGEVLLKPPPPKIELIMLLGVPEPFHSPSHFWDNITVCQIGKITINPRSAGVGGYILPSPVFSR